jgi:exodeoxyribonuclease VII large subunit
MSDERKVYSLYQLNRSIKNALETKAGEAGFWVKAEIAKITFSKTGHVYIDFVQEDKGVRKAAIRGMIWSRTIDQIKSELGTSSDSVLKNGSEIIFQCKVTFHEVFGLSLTISEIDLTFMLGELERRKSETIARVKKEGIDRLNKLKSLPTVIHKIALVGSPGTSGFRDFAHHVIHNEWKFRFDIEVFSAPVQGAEAASKIVSAIKLANASNPDVIVLVRGGGSPLDLDCFNDLELAMTIGNLNTPVLTGIGHETDFCVADLVAHKYFKTPTDVGDFMVDRTMSFASILVEISTKVGSRSNQILNRESNMISSSKLLIRELSNKLITEKRSSFDQIKTDLKREIDRVLEKQKESLSTILNTINLLRPENTLSRGYSIIRSDNKAVKEISSLNIGDVLDIQMSDGNIHAIVNDIKLKSDDTE